MRRTRWSLALAATLAVSLAWSSPALAGCEKDTDCKGDRICEQGACVTPQVPPASRILGVWGIALTRDEQAQLDAARAALRPSRKGAW